MTLVKMTTLCILMMASNAFADTPTHPIDSRYDLCMAKSSNATVAKDRVCIKKATASWDKELNKNYELVMQQSDKKQKKMLKKAQRSWLIFRDNELALIRYRDPDTLNADKDYLAMERQRALKLESLIINEYGDGDHDPSAPKVKPEDRFDGSTGKPINPDNATFAKPIKSINFNYDKCLADSNSVTADMRNCTNTAISKWDKALNVNYKILTKQSNKKQKAALKKAQRSWLKFRDGEMDFLRSTATGGTYDALMQSGSYLEKVKQRTLILRDHIIGTGED